MALSIWFIGGPCNDYKRAIEQSRFAESIIQDPPMSLRAMETRREQHFISTKPS